MMRKFSPFLYFIIFLFLGACNHTPLDIDEEPFVLSDEERWMEYICSPSRMGRKAGTAGCDSVAVYIQHVLEGMNYDVVTQPFMIKDSLDLKNLYVVIKGYSDSLIVIGAHYDGAKNGKRFPAADDNGSGVVSLLSLCKYYSQSDHKPPKTLIAGFWGAEEVTAGAAFNGSKYFVKSFEDIKLIKYYCNLDCFARKGVGTFFYYSHGLQWVGSIMADLFTKVNLEGMEFSVKENDKKSSDYMSFYNAKIPYFGWNDYSNSSFIHSSDDTINNISFEQITAVVDLTTKLIDRL